MMDMQKNCCQQLAVPEGEDKNADASGANQGKTGTNSGGVRCH